jgi:hypothetical protein
LWGVNDVSNAQNGSSNHIPYSKDIELQCDNLSIVQNTTVSMWIFYYLVVCRR